MEPPVLRLWSALLGPDTHRHQRMQVTHALLTLSVYLAFAVVQHVEVIWGLIDPAQSWPLTAWNLTGGFGFYLVLRSGLNQRLKNPRSRALAIPQSAWAMVGITWSYAITGPARGAVILIMMVVMIFGIFSLTPAQSRYLVATCFGMLASVMIYKGLTDPLRYDPRVEAMHLIFAGIVLLAVTALSVRISKLKRHLQQRGAELSEALQRIQALATHDELTGLANRRAALERMQQNLASRALPDGPARPAMGLALIDIDHFKRVNDTLGHAAGDEVLRSVAAVGQAMLRTEDLLARWGGEEFLLVMPNATGPQVAATLARWRDALRAQSFDHLAPGLRVSFSAGVAECWEREDMDAAVARADAAMYAAKHGGRDRILCEADLPAPAASATGLAPTAARAAAAAKDAAQEVC